MLRITIPFFNRKQPKRELPLVYVHTFKTGEKIYTYRPEDYGKISSRYYRQVQEASNYLQTFALTKNEWEAALNKLKANITDAIDKPTLHKQTLLDVNSTFDWFIAKAAGLKGANEVILEMLYCMFYVLEEEKETGYSEAYNKHKIDLLNNEPEKRDFFLSSLSGIMNNLGAISREDTLGIILELERTKERLMSFHTPTN
jgi:hypothetical protein